MHCGLVFVSKGQENVETRVRLPGHPTTLSELGELLIVNLTIVKDSK